MGGGLQHMDKMKFLYRKKYSDCVYLEVIKVRKRNGREEWLSRWAYSLSESNTLYYGYRWRKLCGKNIFIPSLGRCAKDFHNCAITVRNPFNGRMSRAYLREFEGV